MRITTVLFLMIFASYLSAQKTTIYVDTQLTVDCKGNYSITDRNCSGSDGDAYTNLQSAAKVADAGTLVLIREGVYNTQLIPQNSGNANAYITFKNFNNENVILTGANLAPAIMIDRKDYIVIEGLKIHDVRYWLSALGSNHIIVRNNIFEKALDSAGSSKTGIFFQSSNYGKILNNIINESTQDNIALLNSDYNLIEGNTVTKAKHTLWTLKCSNYNILRNNYFHNEDQKIGEVFDCGNAGFGNADFPKLNAFDATKHNVIEKNIFAYTPSPGDASPYSGIQYAGQNGIIRNNIFYECEGPPIALTLYSEEAKYNYGNRIYHNVFYKNEFGAIDISGGTTGYTFYDQKIKNNIFYKNEFIRRDMRWNWYIELDEKPVQIKTARTSDIVIERNNLFHSGIDELYVIAYGERTSSSNPAPNPLSWWEANHSRAFTGNLQAIPEFVDEDNYDFRLKENSLMIDAGAFLTFTTNSGMNSTEMRVSDATWFIDGFGIVTGDTIQVEGQNDFAIVQSINYKTNLLNLDKPISWNRFQGISLRYSGSAPDIGAYEYWDRSVGLSKKLFDEKKITITPNPASDSIIIGIVGTQDDIIKKIVIYNKLGQQVMTINNKKEVNISGLHPGVYNIMVIFHDGVTITEKITKI